MKPHLRTPAFTPAWITATVLASPAGAQTQQVCHSDDIPLENTNWVHAATVPKFDAGLGTLQSIQFTIVGNVVGSAAEESLDGTSSLVTLQFSSMMMLTRPDGSIIDIALPTATFNDTLTPFDGTIDYGGTSGVTHANVTATQTTMFMSPPPQSDLALFTGPVGNPGTIDLVVAANGTSIATGSGNVITQFHQQASAHVEVCYLFAPNTPPTFTSCDVTLMASVGVPMSYQICAVDSDPTDLVTIDSVSGLPSGAVLNPPLPVSGNPACTTLSWTPGTSQVGTTVVTFHATDTHLRTASCSLTTLAAECHMLFASAGGNSQQTIFGHPYTTQLAGLRHSFPVTMEDNPSFLFSYLPRAFFVQVVMYNPTVFPQNPSQWSQAVRVIKDDANGTVQTIFTGTENGIDLNAQVFFDSNGSRRIRFPFQIH